MHRVLWRGVLVIAMGLIAQSGPSRAAAEPMSSAGLCTFCGDLLACDPQMISEGCSMVCGRGTGGACGSHPNCAPEQALYICIVNES